MIVLIVILSTVLTFKTCLNAVERYVNLVKLQRERERERERERSKPRVSRPHVSATYSLLRCGTSQDAVHQAVLILALEACVRLDPEHPQPFSTVCEVVTCTEVRTHLSSVTTASGDSGRQELPIK